MDPNALRGTRGWLLLLLFWVDRYSSITSEEVDFVVLVEGANMYVPQNVPILVSRAYRDSNASMTIQFHLFMRESNGKGRDLGQHTDVTSKCTVIFSALRQLVIRESSFTQALGCGCNGIREPETSHDAQGSVGRCLVSLPI